MKKLTLVYLFALLFSLHVFGAHSDELMRDMERGGAFSKAMRIKKEMREGRFGELLDTTTDNIVMTTVGELHSRGFNSDANEIHNAWLGRYKGFAGRLVRGSKDVGDHEAIQWILTIHDKVHMILGDEICRAIRVHDLWYIAYCMPVVIRCVDDVGPTEYERHFTPLLKIVSYWVSYGACVGFTYGTGVVFLCGLVGMGVETIVGNFVAPLLVDPAYNQFCHHNLEYTH